MKEASGAEICVDYPMLCIRVCGDVQSAGVAANLIRDTLRVWQECHSTIAIEEFMITMLVGRSGCIASLEKEAGATIKLNKANLSLDIEVTSADKLEGALSVVSSKVQELRSTHFEMLVDAELVGILLGKNGATIKKFRADTQANIDFNIIK